MNINIREYSCLSLKATCCDRHKDSSLIGFKLSFGVVELQLRRLFPQATGYQRL